MVIRAVIFDLDGTVLDNEPAWEEAFGQVAESNQLSVTSSQSNGWVHEPGIGVEANWKKILSARSVASVSSDRGGQIEKLSRQTREEYKGRQRSANPKIPVRKGVEEVVRWCKGRSWQTALATSSQWYVVEDVLEQWDLYLAFDVTTTGEEVTRLKPDPEIYALTVQKLGLAPEQCLVVEDALAGVESATAAGCPVVGLVSTYASEEALRQSGAGRTAKQLLELPTIL